EVVEIEEEESEQTVAGLGSYESLLVKMADSLADKKFNEDQIALINARGGVAHQAKSDGNGRRTEPRETVAIFRLILLICFRTRASDVHIEPKSDDYAVRIRV